MITPQFCRTMAAYNAWQNAGLRDMVSGLTKKDYTANRGAFFGSIRGTLNHLLWADQIWMSRFDGGPAPEGGIAESAEITATVT